MTPGGCATLKRCSTGNRCMQRGIQTTKTLLIPECICTPDPPHESVSGGGENSDKTAIRRPLHFSHLISTLLSAPVGLHEQGVEGG